MEASSEKRYNSSIVKESSEEANISVYSHEIQYILPINYFSLLDIKVWVPLYQMWK